MRSMEREASHSLGDLVEEFSEELAEDPQTSPRTAEFYRADLREFVRYVGDEKGGTVGDITAIRSSDVMSFRNHLLEGNRKRFTVYRKDAAVRRFLDWVRTVSDVEFDYDPIEPMHQPLDQSIVFLDDEEATQLLSFPTHNRYDLRDSVMMRLMLDTGVTVGEVRLLLRSDLDLDERQARLGGPGSHLAPRTLRLTPETVSVLKEYFEAREDSTPEVVIGRAARPVSTSKSLQNAIWKRCEQVGMWRVSPMVLRHTFAIRLLRRGASLGDLKEAMGVRDTSNIGVYRKFA